MIDSCKKNVKENNKSKRQNNKNKECRNNKLREKYKKGSKKLRNIIVPPFYLNLILIQESVINESM